MAGQSKARVEDESMTPEVEQLEKNLIEILAKKAEADASQISRDQKLSDLDMDSLDFVELIFDLEEEYDVEIPYNANESRLEEMTIKDFLVIAIPALTDAKEAGAAIGES